MENIQQAYDEWAGSYNDVVNPTRDMELEAKKLALRDISFTNALELGCGTGKNTEWLLQKAKSITSVDFSANMLAKAKERIKSGNVNFIQADINEPWDFVSGPFDLITCSLVLEHIENLQPVFEKAFQSLIPGGIFISVNCIRLNNTKGVRPGLKKMTRWLFWIVIPIMCPNLFPLHSAIIFRCCT